MTAEQAQDYCKRKADFVHKQQQGVQKVRTSTLASGRRMWLMDVYACNLCSTLICNLKQAMLAEPKQLA